MNGVMDRRSLQTFGVRRLLEEVSVSVWEEELRRGHRCCLWGISPSESGASSGQGKKSRSGVKCQSDFSIAKLMAESS